jgi:hypothetical protein
MAESARLGAGSSGAAPTLRRPVRRRDDGRTSPCCAGPRWRPRFCRMVHPDVVIPIPGLVTRGRPPTPRQDAADTPIPHPPIPAPLPPRR